MPVSPDFREYVVDQLGRIAPVAARGMFGGVGLYSDGLFFGLIDDDRVYLKVDASNRGEFEALGMKAFAPYGDAAKAMQYYELPGDLLEDRDRLRPWIEKAIQVARTAAGRKAKKKRG